MMREAAETWAWVSWGRWHCYLPTSLLPDEGSEETQPGDPDGLLTPQVARPCGTEHAGCAVRMSPRIPVALGIFLQLKVPREALLSLLVPTSDASHDFSHHDLCTGDLQPKTSLWAFSPAPRLLRKP